MTKKNVFAVYELDPYRKKVAYLVTSPYDFAETIEILGNHLELGLQYYHDSNDLVLEPEDYLHYLSPTDLFYWAAKYLQDRKPELGIGLLEIDGDLYLSLPVGYFLPGWKRYEEELFAEWVAYDELRKFVQRRELLSKGA